MVDYVEYPTDLLRKIVVPKKKDDGGGEPPPDEDTPGACGYWSTALPLWPRFPGMFSPQKFGLWALYYAIVNGEQWVSWFYAPRGNPHYEEIYDYLWFKPASFTVSIFGPDIPSALQVAIRVWRNANPQAFHPCTTPEYAEVVGPYVSSTPLSINIQPQTPTEAYPPLFMVTGTDGLRCSPLPSLYLTVQAHCAQETDGGLPPQIPGWPTDNQGHFMNSPIGPALPSSYFYPGTPH